MIERNYIAWFCVKPRWEVYGENFMLVSLRLAVSVVFIFFAYEILWLFVVCIFSALVYFLLFLYRLRIKYYYYKELKEKEEGEPR